MTGSLYLILENLGKFCFSPGRKQLYLYSEQDKGQNRTKAWESARYLSCIYLFNDSILGIKQGVADTAGEMKTLSSVSALEVAS